ncbi:MAG TPA: class I SAM-dependent methyltransferase [Bacillus bacterium]|nr:class I SAM-dependent methyltransferase [Bacillus sp. (in: firmicutes)]
MVTFDKYAEYYDLLYKDKNYQQEVEYIHRLIQEYQPSAKSILELGCGTGKHAILLHKQGYTVHGIDLSGNMVKKAKELLQKETIDGVQFTHGDIRTIRLNETFDVVVSLFHVMSYQTTNEDILKAFSTASTHLKPTGLFIFDCWHGPAVLSEQPETRVKRLENDEIEVVRIAEPTLNLNENTVDVNYDIYITDKGSQKITRFSEVHKMRYLFTNELEFVAKNFGLKRLKSFEFLIGKELDLNSWNACYVFLKE